MAARRWERGEISLTVPSIGGMIDMRIDLWNVGMLHLVAHCVALKGFECLRESRKILAATSSVEYYNFLNPENLHHEYFVYRLAQLRTPMYFRIQVPRLPMLSLDIRGCNTEILSLADTTALHVARIGPELEEEILADSKESDTVYFNGLYCFLKPDDSFHGYYQHRLMEYRTLLQSPAQEGGAAAAASLATRWKGSSPSDDRFREEPEGYFFESASVDGTNREIFLSVLELTEREVNENWKARLACGCL